MHLPTSLLPFLPLLTLSAPLPTRLQNILANTHGQDDLYTYPTDLTRGIVPIPIHSHNDYWRDVPFYSALHAGAISIEADVWLVNGTLYVGHEPSALTRARTLHSLYLTPILSVLHQQNPTTPFTSPSSGTKNGVFDTNPQQTLYLYIDLKTSSATTWPAVLAALAPLHAAGWLSTWDNTSTAITTRPLTVIATGNTPLDPFLHPENHPPIISPENPRFVFLDADLPSLLPGGDQAALSSTAAPVASTSFTSQFGRVTSAASPPLNATQLATLRAQVAAAHERGVMVRYWDLPAWPLGTRNRVWRMLVDEGVDLVNVDDLRAVGGLWGME